MDQPTFVELEFHGKKRKTRRELFLERMDDLVHLHSGYGGSGSGRITSIARRTVVNKQCDRGMMSKQRGFSHNQAVMTQAVMTIGLK